MTNYNQVISSSRAYKIILQDKKQNKFSHTYLLVSEDQDYCLAFAAEQKGEDLENKK